MIEATPVVFDTFETSSGVLCVYESGKKVPFVVKRVFTVRGRTGLPRGDHAHRHCAQLLVCIVGGVKVRCDNGHFIKEYVLDHVASGLLIPPGVWATQDYLDDNAVLMVLCDRGFEAEDYIRDYSDFKLFLETEKK